MSHMIADTNKELHRMARNIGVARRHFQNTTSGPHYDIAISKRKLALQNGAVSITIRQSAKMSFVRRVRGKLPKPKKVERIWQEVQDELRAKAEEHHARRDFIREQQRAYEASKRKIKRVRLTGDEDGHTPKRAVKRVRLEEHRGEASAPAVRITPSKLSARRGTKAPSRKRSGGFF